MTETLLSPSNILLFGRKVEDLEIKRPSRTRPGEKIREVRLATTVNLPNLANLIAIDGVEAVAGDKVLVKDQNNKVLNGVYIVRDGLAWVRAFTNADIEDGLTAGVREGTRNAETVWRLQNSPIIDADPQEFKSIDDPRHGPFAEDRAGSRGDVEQQLTANDKKNPPCFARIYGFSYEGMYYELPRPALFLVHGDGREASEARQGGVVNRARALGDPSLTGLAAADFQFADDLRVWSYDKADYTIRMDVESGMLEDILLDILGGGGPGASGARVSGARVSGARVSGARVSGARLSGGRGDAGD